MNGYYTRAQQARAARSREGDTGYGALEDFRLAVDDHWWMANVLLFHADALNSRYRLNLQVCSPTCFLQMGTRHACVIICFRMDACLG